MNKNKKDNDTKNKDRIKRMIVDTVRKDLASRPKEWSYEELVELDPRLSDNSDF